MSANAPESKRFQRASDQSLLIYFGQQITLDAHEHVRKLLRLLESDPIAGNRNLHPAYCSVLVKFDALKCRHAGLDEILKQHRGRLPDETLPETPQGAIPVSSDGCHAPD